MWVWEGGAPPYFRKEEDFRNIRHLLNKILSEKMAWKYAKTAFQPQSILKKCPDPHWGGAQPFPDPIPLHFLIHISGSALTLMMMTDDYDDDGW